MKFTPSSDNIIVKASDRPEQTKSGLYIPTTGTDGVVTEGKVIAVGEGRWLESGTLVKSKVTTNDTVWFPKFNATEVTIDGDKFLVVSERYVLGYNNERPF